MATLKRMIESPNRIYAIGDIHGCADELDVLLSYLENKAQIGGEDLVVFIGDYIDRGPASRQVIDRLLSFREDFPYSVFLKGNHEDMLLSFLGFEGRMGPVYLVNGGLQTLVSYGCLEAVPGEVTRGHFPEAHLKFLTEELTDYLETPKYVFAHAGLGPLAAIEEQSEEDLFWIRDEFIMNIHHFEKTIVFGHTPYHDIMFHLPYKIGIDTGLVYGNKLSCIELNHGHVFQVEREKNAVQVGSFRERLEPSRPRVKKDKPLRRKKK